MPDTALSNWHESHPSVFVITAKSCFAIAQLGLQPKSVWLQIHFLWLQDSLQVYMHIERLLPGWAPCYVLWRMHGKGCWELLSHHRGRGQVSSPLQPVPLWGSMPRARGTARGPPLTALCFWTACLQKSCWRFCLTWMPRPCCAQDVWTGAFITWPMTILFGSESTQLPFHLREVTGELIQ